MYKLLLVLLKIVDLWWSSSCFSIGRGRTTDIRRHRQLLFAEGAPKYQKQNGILQHSECVGEGSYLLHIDYDKNSNDGDGDDSFEDGYYQPGHVLALEIQPPDRTTADIITDTEKSANINAYSLSSSSSSSSSSSFDATDSPAVVVVGDGSGRRSRRRFTNPECQQSCTDFTILQCGRFQSTTIFSFGGRRLRRFSLLSFLLLGGDGDDDGGRT